MSSADPAGWQTAKVWAAILGAVSTVVSAMLVTALSVISKSKELSICVAVLPYLAAFWLWIRRWEVAKPDEWLLVLRDGHLVGQGIGLRAFCGWRDTVTKFPAAIQKVRFTATQVDREMQGLEVSGYLSWSINREGEGPWNAYKYLAMRDVDGDGRVDSDTGSQHVAEMAKAVLRSQIANSTLQDVFTQREGLRDKVRQSMMEQVKGWGVWVEAVEISDIRICSNSLFQDLQATHRQKVRLRAEEARLQTERQIQEKAMTDDLHMSKTRAEADAEKRLVAAQQSLRAEQQEAALFAQQAEAAKARILMEEEIELAQVTKKRRVRLAEAEADAAVSRLESESEIERLRGQFEADRNMPEATLKRLSMELTAKIYGNLPLRDVRLNVFGSDHAGSAPSLTNMLPSLATSWEMLTERPCTEKRS